MVEIVGNKGAEALCARICNVLQEKDVNIGYMRFNGIDGTNTMSGEISGLQRCFRHIPPHTKYMNCHNHKLALAFVHLLDQYEALKAVNTSLISVWKLMKYSSVKSAVYGEAKVAEGLRKLKLLKAAPTRWSSYAEATEHLISRFQPLIDSLDTMIMKDQKPETIGICNELLKPETILMPLIVADVLVPIFLQKKTLIYADISRKFQQILERIEKLKRNDGSFFKENAVPFLTVS